MPQVAIVILNYNGKKFLQDFLRIVVRHSANNSIWIVDNASTDDSLAFVRNEFSEVKIFQLTYNLGFAGGYNTALKQIEADYYILLNSDVEVSPFWVEPVIHLMESNQSIAACQPKILSFSQKDKFEYAGAAGGFIDKYGYPFCRGRIFDTCEKDLEQYNNTVEIFWATGACMFIRAKVFHDLGGFDANFFAHMEEIDLCWRIKNAGFQIYYCADSTVYHVGGGTLNKSNPRKTFLNYRNGLALLYKNLPENKLILTIFIRLLLDAISGIKLFLDGSFADTCSIIKAHFSFYGWLLNSKILREKNTKDLELIYKKSIVWQYFIRNKRKFSDLNF